MSGGRGGRDEAEEAAVRRSAGGSDPGPGAVRVLSGWTARQAARPRRRQRQLAAWGLPDVVHEGESAS